MTFTSHSGPEMGHKSTSDRGPLKAGGENFGRYAEREQQIIAQSQASGQSGAAPRRRAAQAHGQQGGNL